MLVEVAGPPIKSGPLALSFCEIVKKFGELGVDQSLGPPRRGVASVVEMRAETGAFKSVSATSNSMAAPSSSSLISAGHRTVSRSGNLACHAYTA